MAGQVSSSVIGSRQGDASSVTAAPPANERSLRWRGFSNLLPALAFLSIFFLLPLVALLLRGVLEPTPGFGNYAQLFANSAYVRVLVNTFSVAGLVTLSTLSGMLSLPFALGVLR